MVNGFSGMTQITKHQAHTATVEEQTNTRLSTTLIVQPIRKGIISFIRLLRIIATQQKLVEELEINSQSVELNSIVMMNAGFGTAKQTKRFL